MVSGQDRHPRKAGGSCAGEGRVCRSDFRTRARKSRVHERGSGGNIGEGDIWAARAAAPSPWGASSPLGWALLMGRGGGGARRAWEPISAQQDFSGLSLPRKGTQIHGISIAIRLSPQRTRSQAAIPVISPPASVLSTKELRDFLKASTEQRQTFGWCWRLVLSPQWLDSMPRRICLRCKIPRFDPWVGKIPWRRKWQPTPVSLPGKSHGQRSLVG